MMSLATIIEATLWMTVLYGYYRIFLSRLAWFQFNRFYLLVLIPGSFTITWLQLPSVYRPILYPEFNWEVVILSEIEKMGPQSTIVSWIEGIYIAGLVLFGVYACIQLIRLLGFIYFQTDRIKRDTYTLVLSEGKVPVSSFFRYIIWDESWELDEIQQQQVLAHELCHIRQWHSLDRLLIQIFLVVLWFHPLVYLIRRDLIQTHEYQADRASVCQYGKRAYVSLMLNNVLKPGFDLSHTFSNSLIKNRIMMLTQTVPTRRTWFSYLLLIPLVSLLIFISSCEKHAETVSSMESGGLEVQQLDVKPKPVNMAEVQRQMGYPKEIRDQNMEGTVIVRVLVDEKGGYVRHELIKKDHEMLAKPVEENVSLLKFEPAEKDGQAVQAWINIPFSFKLIN